MLGPIVFSLVAFGPALIFLAPVFLMFALLALMASSKGFVSPQEVHSGLLILAIAGYVAVVVGRCYRLYVSEASWARRGWNIYGAWAALLVPFCYIQMAGDSGMSMPVVNGEISSVDRYLGAGVAAAKMFLFAQVLVIPWTFGAVRMLRYLSARSKGVLEI